MGADTRKWPQTDRVLRQFAQFDRVMECLRVDAVFAVRMNRGAAMKQARDICLACLCQQECRSLLDSDEAAAIMAFCPNAGFFNQCRRPGFYTNMAAKRSGQSKTERW